MWESPGHKAPVALFFSNLKGKRFLRAKTGEYGGKILWEGSMAVGPGSIHPNGGVYKIINDTPLATVSEEQLESILGECLVPKKVMAEVEEAADPEDMLRNPETLESDNGIRQNKGHPSRYENPWT